MRLQLQWLQSADYMTYFEVSGAALRLHMILVAKLLRQKPDVADSGETRECARCLPAVLMRCCLRGAAAERAFVGNAAYKSSDNLTPLWQLSMIWFMHLNLLLPPDSQHVSQIPSQKTQRHRRYNGHRTTTTHQTLVVQLWPRREMAPTHGAPRHAEAARTPHPRPKSAANISTKGCMFVLTSLWSSGQIAFVNKV